MIAVISGTNRPNSRTLSIASCYVEQLKKHTSEPVHLINLEDMNGLVIDSQMYDSSYEDPVVRPIQKEILMPSSKWVIVAPEYNGTYPGILKVFIDMLSIHDYKKTFNNRKIGLIGTATGRGGNARGIDHLTTDLFSVGGHIFNRLLPLSQLNTREENGVWSDSLQSELEKHAIDFIAF